MSGRRAHVAVVLTLIVFSAVSVLAARARPGQKTHTVTIEAMRFQPQSLTVKAGDTIVWSNKDVVAHTATAAGFDSQTIMPGQSWTYLASAKGDFPYICTLHPAMKATLRVK